MAMTGGAAYRVLSKYANFGAANWTIDLYVYVKQISQDISNNETNLSLGMYVQTPGSAYDIYWTDFNGSYLGIGAFGNGAEDITRFTKSVNGGGTIWLVEDVNVTVKHRDDGTAQNVPIKWKWGVNAPWGQYVNPSGTLNVTLPTIPRVSSVTATNGTIGTPISISINRGSSLFTHTLTYSFGGVTGTITTNTTNVSLNWTPPMSLCNEIPAAPSGTCTITCATYSGDTLLGESTTEVTLTVPSSVSLTCSNGWVTVAPYNVGTTASALSKYIVGISKAKFTFDPLLISTESSYGAEISHYKILFNNSELTAPYLTSILNSSGTVTAICYVYDTRGRFVTENITFTVEGYTQPTLSNVECFRCDETGTAGRRKGTYLYVNASCEYTPLNGDNSATIRVRYKSSGGTYGDYTALTDGVGMIIGGGSISVQSSYIVEISAIDTLQHSSKIETTIKSGRVFFKATRGGKGAGINKYPEHDGYIDMGFGLWMDGTYIKGLPAPIDDNDAVNKRYVDNATPNVTLSSLGLTVTAAELNGGKIKYTNISNNADLDDYRTPGHYRSSSSSNTIYNKPEGCSSAFELIVGSINNSGYYCSQIIKDFSKNAMWVRTAISWNSVNFTDWDAFNFGTSGGEVTLLYSGTLTTGSTTFNYGDYKAYIIIGQVTASQSNITTIIPKDAITTDGARFQIADESNYYSFKMSYSGTTTTLAYYNRNGSGQIVAVYGMS